MADKNPTTPPEPTPPKPLTEAERVARLDRFIGNVSDLVWASCVSCVRKSRGGFCEAYPNGIPTEILDGRVDHFTVFPGDHGLTYLAISPAPPTAPKNRPMP